MSQPEGLVVVLRGNRQGVEGNDQDHQPVEDLGFHQVVTLPAEDAIPLPPVSTAGDGKIGILYFQPCVLSSHAREMMGVGRSARSI